MFLLNPILLLFFGFLSYYIGDRYGHRTRFPVSKFLAYFSFAVMTFAAVSLYMNNPIMDWMWRPCFPFAESGRDFMVNSLIFSFPFNPASPGNTPLENMVAYNTDAIAAVLFALYPLWLYIGIYIQKRWAPA